MASKQEMVNDQSVLIIGVGNEHRCDDALGLYVARRLERKTPDHVNILEQSGDGTLLIELWKDVKTVIIIDAVHSGSKPGTIYRFTAHAQPVPTSFFHYSTHAFGVAEAIELSRALNQLPNRLIVYGIEGKCFDIGVGLSSEVEKATLEVVTTVQQDIHDNLIR